MPLTYNPETDSYWFFDTEQAAAEKEAEIQAQKKWKEANPDIKEDDESIKYKQVIETYAKQIDNTPITVLDKVIDTSKPKMTDLETGEAIESEPTVRTVQKKLVPITATHFSTKDEMDYLVNTQKWLIDRIIPMGSVNILLGDSGVGKTRWVLRFISDICEEREVLGYSSHRTPYLYVSCDRGLRSIARVRQSIGLGGWDISAKHISQIKYMFGLHTGNWYPKLTEYPKLFPSIKFFIIEGAGIYQSDAKDYNLSGNFWMPIQEAYERAGAVLLCVYHPPKGDTTMPEKRPRGRESMPGSSANQGWTDSILGLYKANPTDKKDRRRILTIEPRDAPAFEKMYIMTSEGRLEPLTQEDLEKYEANSKSPKKSELNEFLDGIQKPFFSLDELLIEANKRKISRATACRWIDEMVEKKVVKRVAKGCYAKAVV